MPRRVSDDVGFDSLTAVVRGKTPRRYPDSRRSPLLASPMHPTLVLTEKVGCESCLPMSAAKGMPSMRHGDGPRVGPVVKEGWSADASQASPDRFFEGLRGSNVYKPGGGG